MNLKSITYTFITLPRKLIFNILKYLFHKKRIEATILWMIIIFTILAMNTDNKAQAYQTETYNLNENGEPILEFNLEVPNTHWRLPTKTFFTSYNPEVGQCDSSPCIGAHGTNVCDMAKQGIRTIALSQDMVGRATWKKYHYGEKVMLYSDNPQCRGIFQIEDTMNKRYTNRGDLFQLTRATNTSCFVTVTKL